MTKATAGETPPFSCTKTGAWRLAPPGVEAELLDQLSGVRESMGRKRVTNYLMLASLTAVVAACGYAKPNPTDPAYQGLGSPTDPFSTKVGGEGGLFDIGAGKTRNHSGGGGGGGIGVNAFLWRGALDTLSFLPLTSADPFGGVIITDWYTPADAQGERFKATAYILGRELRSDGIRVSVFRQVSHGGRWVDAPVASAVQGELENKVLERARKMREQASGSS